MVTKHSCLNKRRRVTVMQKIIDGKAISQALAKELAIEVSSFRSESTVTPCLAVVLVGEDPASKVYVRNKIRVAAEVGIDSLEFRFSDDCAQAELLERIDSLNGNEKVHGILVQLPLPDHIDEKMVLEAIDHRKDVDGFHPMNVGALAIGEADLTPCTPLGCMLLLKSVHEDLSGKLAVVVGRSNIVGKPIAQLLLQENCSVMIVHSKSENIEALCAQADIVVAAVGRPKMIKSSWIKPGATVIDVGINAIDVDGKRKLVGDVDFDDVQSKASYITPVPGGVGPMTIACLMRNTIVAAKAQVQS